MTPLHDAVAEVLRGAGMQAPGPDALVFEGRSPDLGARHRIVEACACAAGAQAGAAARLHEQRSGIAQQVAVDLAHAALALRPGRLQTQNGHSMDPHTIVNEPVNGFFRCGDGRWIFLVGSYPHLRNGLLRLLDCANDKPAIARAVARWDGAALEEAAALDRLTAGLVRTPAEWSAHPQAGTLNGQPVVAVEKIAEGAPMPLPPAQRPLSGLRVLDLTHVIAGPVLARTLAEHGAEVLHVSSPRWPDPLPMIMDTGIGKRSAYLALERAADRETMRGLLARCDVFVQSWRPGSMERLGYGPADVAAMRPGIVYVSASAFGLEGPWATRGAFDQIAQCVSGIAHVEGDGETPRLVPTYLMNDYLSAYLGAAGVARALARRSREGGSYHVKVSLARTSMWVQSLGPPDRGAADQADTVPDARFMERRSSPFGELEQLRPVAKLSRTPARWVLPPEPLGASRPAWQ